MFALRILLLVVGVFACSTAAIFITACGEAASAAQIAAWRLLLGGVLLLPLYLRARRRHPGFPPGRLVVRVLPAAVLLALHFWSWNVGVQASIVTNASLIVNMTAPVMPLVAWLVLREGVSRRELAGTAVAFAGCLVLGAADYRFNPEYFFGDCVCFGSMLLFCCYLVWSRRSRAVPSIWLYAPPVYLLAGVVCLVGARFTDGDPLPRGWQAWWPILGLVLIPTIVGHSILNRSMQVLRSQLVAAVNLGQFVPAGLLAWLFFGQVPGWQFPVAVALVAGGSLMVIFGRRRQAGRHPARPRFEGHDRAMASSSSTNCAAAGSGRRR